MILTLITTFLGFFTSLMPEVVSMFKGKQDNAHELAVLELQMKAAAQGHSAKLEEIGANADIVETQEIYKTYTTGITWVDALNGSVRPVISYGFFLLYSFMKVIQLKYVDTSLPWTIEALWTQNDWAVFGAIVGFYFGQRGLNKALGRK